MNTRQSFVWLVIFSGTIILIQSEVRYKTWIAIYRSLLINAARFVIWFWHTFIYNMQQQLWKSKSISHSYSLVSFRRMNWYVCNLTWSRYKLEQVPSKQLPSSPTSQATFPVVCLMIKFQDKTRTQKNGSVVFAHCICRCLCRVLST